MPEHTTGQMGGTMRLGLRKTVFIDGCDSVIRKFNLFLYLLSEVENVLISEKLYGHVSSVEERHRHRYEVNPDYVARIEEKGLKFVGQAAEGIKAEEGKQNSEKEMEMRMEICELKGMHKLLTFLLFINHYDSLQIILTSSESNFIPNICRSH